MRLHGRVGNRGPLTSEPTLVRRLELPLLFQGGRQLDVRRGALPALLRKFYVSWAIKSPAKSWLRLLR